ncbi:indole-3-glycerol phosphate synthase TrpC [Oceanobacillus sp. HCA-5259]|uniref:indole-3-glycerol phosphate synthase TrpC n=1 Tax=Oceanobacillus sp. HCA-5259 TaxID=3134661 RepID=UPI0030BB4D53
MTILDNILKQKRIELTELIHKKLMEPVGKANPSFKGRAAASENMNIIAEIKRASPSKGAIDLEVDPIEQAKTYEKNGAAAISVLTDEKFFNGSLEDLRAVREAVDVPVLCKDFIIDTLQIDHARAAGATIILLIVAALSDEDLKKLYDYATSLELEVLVEVHDEEEMKRAVKLEPEIIGINNRNLKTFEVDVAITEKLASLVTDRDTLLISESGMREREDVQRVRDVGAEAILVGETLMLAEDLQRIFTNLQVPLKEGKRLHVR